MKKKIGFAVLLTVFIAGILFSIYCYFNNRAMSFFYRITRAVGIEAATVNKMHQIIDDVDIFKYFSKPDIGQGGYVDLVMNRADLAFISSQIEEFKKLGYMKDELKAWRKAKILINGHEEGIKFKLHGTSVTPLERGGFSLRIRHAKESRYLDYMREYALITAVDEAEVSTIAINKLAADYGLIAPFGRMVVLRINHVNMGLYYLVENHRKEWLERNYGITNYTMIKPNDDWDRRTPGHSSDLDLYPENQESSGTSERTDIALGMFDLFTQAIREKNLPLVKQFLDVDYMAKYAAVGALFNDVHFISGDNIRYIYDFTRGKFFLLYRQEGSIQDAFQSEVSSFNRMWFESQGEFYRNAPTQELFKLLIQDGEFRSKRDQYLWNIVSSSDSIFQTVDQVFLDNKPVILNSRYPRRLYNFNRWLFLKRLRITLDLARKYLNYAKVFVSVENLGSRQLLSMKNDSYQPVALKEIVYSDGETESKVRFDDVLPANDLDGAFRMIYRDNRLELPGTGLPITALQFTNMTTGKEVAGKDVYLNQISRQRLKTIPDLLKDLARCKINFTRDQGTIRFLPGRYDVDATIVFPAGLSLEIAAGTQLALGPGVSFLVKGRLTACGTASAPIVVRNRVPGQPFGSFAVLADKSTKISLSHFQINGGGESFVEGAHFTGMLAIHGGDLEMSHVTVTGSSSDDGLNAKNCQVSITACVFKDNFADQVDLDFCDGSVKDCSFIAPGTNEDGDGLDVSGCQVEVTGCTIRGFLDKGLSIGEASWVLAKNNQFFNNKAGSAVKEGSTAFFVDDIFQDNATDIKMYVKKPFFKAPVVYLSKSLEHLNVEKSIGQLFVHDNNTLEQLYYGRNK